jgi:hypothetical protein
MSGCIFVLNPRFTGFRAVYPELSGLHLHPESYILNPEFCILYLAFYILNNERGDFMLHTEYDVIVVGAGPGGSIAAKVAAENGLSVLLLEKRQEIGAPVR